MGVLDGNRVAIVTGAGTGLGPRHRRGARARRARDIAVLEIDARLGAGRARRARASSASSARAYPTDVADRRPGRRGVRGRRRATSGGSTSSSTTPASAASARTRRTSPTRTGTTRSPSCRPASSTACARRRGSWSRRESGAVVNISSIRGFSPNPGRMTYCAPKAAVIMMTQVAAGEWAPHGIRVNAIAPGVLRTPMWDADVARGAIDEPLLPRRRADAPARARRPRSASWPSSSARTTPPTSPAPCITIDGALTSIPAG